MTVLLGTLKTLSSGSWRHRLQHMIHNISIGMYRLSLLSALSSPQLIVPFHTHTRTKGRLIAFSLCTAVITYVLLYGYSPFCADNTKALAQQNADPEIEFQSLYLNLISGEAKSFIRRLAVLDLLHCPTQRFYVTLAYPPPHHNYHYRLTTPRRPLPRRHNWSPRAKWHSALTDIRAANNFSYFTATASRSSTQSSGG